MAIEFNGSFRSSKIQYFFIIVSIILISNASIFTFEDNYIIGISLILFILFLFKGNHFDRIIFIVLTFWTLINIFSSIHNDSPFIMYTFLGTTLKILFPYLLLKLVGPTFFDKLEKVVFLFTIISLPLFLLEILAPGLMRSLAEYLNFITGNKEAKADQGWYAVVYMHNAWAKFRNSGFMWEPGAFAMMIILSVLYNLFTYDFKGRRYRILIYLIALFSTLSTMGFVVITIIIAMYLFRKGLSFYSILLVPLLVIYILQVKDLEFIGPKIEEATENYNRFYYEKEQSFVKLDRIGFFVYAVNVSIDWPFGNGILENESQLKRYGDTVMGVSSLAYVLIMWGWIGLLFLFWSFYLFFRRIGPEQRNPFVLFLAVIALSFAFFSNPLHKNAILFLIIYFPYIYKNPAFARNSSQNRVQPDFQEVPAQ